MNLSVLSACSVVQLLLVAVQQPLYAQQTEPAAIKPRLPPRDSLFDSTFVAQQSQDSAARANANRANCWRPTRRRECPGHFLTELGVEFPIASTRRMDVAFNPGGRGLQRDFGTRLVWTFGFMGTKGNNSYGGTWSLIGEDEDAEDVYIPFVLEGRYKRWINDRWSADAALGYRRAQVWRNGVGLVGGHGATLMLGVVANPYVGVTLRSDLIRGGDRTTRSLMAGITSTRGSEFLLKTVALGLLRAALGAIGIHVGEDDE
jgi:hypothetical protein